VRFRYDPPMKNPEIKVERWEADEYVLTCLGKVQGQTFKKKDAEMIAQWWRSIDFSSYIQSNLLSVPYKLDVSKPFSLDDITNGIAILNKLGIVTTGLVLGKREWKELQSWPHQYFFFFLKINPSEVESEMILQTNVWMGHE
jgi:hypothetical protein